MPTESSRMVSPHPRGWHPDRQLKLMLSVDRRIDRRLRRRERGNHPSPVWLNKNRRGLDRGPQHLVVGERGSASDQRLPPTEGRTLDIGDRKSQHPTAG